MKEYSKKFLNKSWESDGSDGTMSNAKKAEKRLGLPKELWLELSKHWQVLADIFSNKDLRDEHKINSAFMAGVVIGWVEKNNKIK